MQGSSITWRGTSSIGSNGDNYKQSFYSFMEFYVIHQKPITMDTPKNQEVKILSRTTLMTLDRGKTGL